LKSVSEATYIAGDAEAWGVDPGTASAVAQAMYEDFAMTIEILHLAAQIQQWLNHRVARHLAEQAERLSR
jgi:hypothetical protein